MKLTKYLFLLIPLFHFGCSNTSSNNIFNLDVDIDSYEIGVSTPSNQLPRIDTESSVFYALPNEERDIYIYGWTDETTAQQTKQVSVNLNGSTFYGQIGNGPNALVKEQSPGYAFTLPIKILSPSTIGTYDMTINYSSTSIQGSLVVMNRRYFGNITYKYMQNCDMFINIPDFSTLLSSAFAEAGTEIGMSYNSTVITETNIPYNPFQNLTYSTYFWLQSYLPSNPVSHSTYFFALSNYDDPVSLYSGYRGVTPKPEDYFPNLNRHRVSVVFTKNFDDINVTEDQKNRLKVCTAIQELGHARGMEVTGNVWNSFANDITNAGHSPFYAGGHYSVPQKPDKKID
ncbi:MAG: hypothetical protein M5U17_04230 [Ignavibacterium sp.]|nr:hypothetical protein [Ignavibacterium sp.]